MGIIKKLLLVLLNLHKWIVSPVLDTVFGKGCIFTPTCSEYAADSIRKYGVVRGIKLSVKRLSRCHPGSVAAYDPVPEGI